MLHGVSEETMESSESDIEAPPPSTTIKPQCDGASDDEADEMVVCDFQDAHEVITVPLAGQENSSEVASTRRFVPSGCAICLSVFAPEEKITWSSNPECAHIYHHDCLLHWFHTVGRKTQRKHKRETPHASETEALELIYKFPKSCPCCRQAFCIETNEENTQPEEEETDQPVTFAENEADAEPECSDSPDQNDQAESAAAADTQTEGEDPGQEAIVSDQNEVNGSDTSDHSGPVESASDSILESVSLSRNTSDRTVGSYATAASTVFRRLPQLPYHCTQYDSR